MILKPTSESSSDWTYALTEVVDCAGTVGQIGIQANEGSGDVTLWVPCYDTSKIVQVAL
jgi:hypothetical protein